MGKENTCFFTGNREIPATELCNVMTATEQSVRDLYNAGYRNFVCGGAIGYDTIAAKCILSLRAELDVKLILVLPCSDQDKNFDEAQKSEYAAIKQSADEVYVLSGRYYRGCMHARNRKMADMSSHCIAYNRKTTGGTVYTMDYARRNGIPIIEI